MGTTAGESLNAAGNIFVGMVSNELCLNIYIIIPIHTAVWINIWAVVKRPLWSRYYILHMVSDGGSSNDKAIAE